MRSDARLSGLMNSLVRLPPEARASVIEQLSPEEVVALSLLLDEREAAHDDRPLLPHQQPPADDDWLGWLLLGGRGAGKTYAAARATLDHVHGEPCHPSLPGGHRMLIVGPSQQDAVDSCVQGTSGLLALDPAASLHTRREGTVVEWTSGAVARINGASTPADVESLRAKGGNCWVWLEELAAWRMLGDDRRGGDPDGNRNAMVHVKMGLRVGTRPRFVASTTPKPRKEVIGLLEDDTVRTARATTRDNPFLPIHIVRDLEQRYGGTRLGRQELDAEVLDDVEGALWSSDGVERDRLTVEEVQGLARRLLVVGVDPPGGATECGIVAVSAALGRDCPCEAVHEQARDPRLPHLLVEHDVSREGSPPEWAGAVVGLYWRAGADEVVAERNFGGDMVSATLATADSSVPVDLVNASRGKRVRAQPIATLAEQGRLHMVGHHEALEAEMTGWDPADERAESPNRLDAMVWAATRVLERLSPSSSRRRPGVRSTPGGTGARVQRSTALARARRSV